VPDSDTLYGASKSTGINTAKILHRKFVWNSASVSPGTEFNTHDRIYVNEASIEITLPL
jgi:hypothetical protein